MIAFRMVLTTLLLSGPCAPAEAVAMGRDSSPVICEAAKGGNADPLSARIAPADPEVISIFSGAGASDISDHKLSLEETRLVNEALAKLPRLHRDVLQGHLRRLSFLDLQPGSGNALTRQVGPDGEAQFDITLKASLLHESLSSFLNTKERRLFEDDGSGLTIEFDAADGDALTYILLHETSHVVDQVLGLTDGSAAPFGKGIWDDARTLAAIPSRALATKTPFRRQPPVPSRFAPAYYASLRSTPFVSLYATAAASEDLAELFAWQQLASHQGQPLTLSVRDRTGALVFGYSPIDTPSVQKRFAQVQTLLDSYESDCV